MTLNADKCHFICLGKDTENGTFIFNKEKKLLITIDNKLTFKSRIKILCKKAPPENRGFIESIKSSKLFPEKINFQFQNKITVQLLSSYNDVLF